MAMVEERVVRDSVVQALSGCCHVVLDNEWCRWLCLYQAGGCGY